MAYANLKARIKWRFKVTLPFLQHGFAPQAYTFLLVYGQSETVKYDKNVMDLDD